MRALVWFLFTLASCGRTTAPAAHDRLVALTPSATEVVAALGATAELVAVDDYSTYPPEVKALPKVGSFLSPNLEAIAALKPSLVIVDDVHGQVAGALHDAGIATIACAMHALPDIKAALRSLGARLGRGARAEAVIQEIDAALERAAAQRPARRPKVLVIIDREAGGVGNLVAAGPGSYVDELLAVVGGDNVLAASGVRYPKVSLEEVVRGQPEVILDLSMASGAGIEAWKVIAVPAVQAGKVVALSQPFLIAPSPRVREALEVLAAAIRM
jgi:iron complex transport system substrate-binding protein